MTQPRTDNTRWTGAKAGAFLKLLARSGMVAPSARAVGMSARSAYRLRERAPKFAHLFDMAREEARRRKAATGRRRAREAVHPLLDPAPIDWGERAELP